MGKGPAALEDGLDGGRQAGEPARVVAGFDEGGIHADD